MSDRRIIRNTDRPMPVLDSLDLKVGVSSVKPKKEFRYITRIIFSIEFPINNILFTNFGADGALTNGLQISYRGKMILPFGLKDMNDFSRIAYDTRIDSDATAATKLNVMISRFSFNRILRKQLGLYIDPAVNFKFLVQDDLSSSNNTAISAVLEGWHI